MKPRAIGTQLVPRGKGVPTWYLIDGTYLVLTVEIQGLGLDEWEKGGNNRV